MSSQQRKSETANQEEFQRSLGLLDGIASWQLRGSLVMILLLPVSIVLLLFPTLLEPFGPDMAGFIVPAFLGILWVASGLTLFLQRDRLGILRTNLIAQRDGATKNHVRAEKFYGLSIVDPLTGLYNRRFGETRLQEEIGRAADAADPLLVLALDFDGFKQINDVHGHAVGDLALKTFSRRLQRAIRACDVPIRVGGDEFLLILPECPPEKVPQIFSRMGSVVLNVEGNQVPVCFSYGTAQCEFGDTPETLIKRADERLYSEKAQRKARVAAEKASKTEPVIQAPARQQAMDSRHVADRTSDSRRVTDGTPDPGQSDEMPAGRVRRSERFPKRIAVLLTADDLLGKVFLEETDTVDLSQHGVAIISRYKLATEQHVILRCLDTNKEAEARVVRIVESQEEGHTYGLAFVSSTANIWDFEFPALERGKAEKAAPPSIFECRLCKGRETAAQGGFSSDDGGAVIARSCKRCGTATPWDRILDTQTVGSTPAPVSVH